MKKVYKKPMLVIENFLVSEHIAACSSSYANNIEFVEADLKFAGYFASGSCDYTLSDGETFNYNGEQVCYHTYADNATVFSS